MEDADALQALGVGPLPSDDLPLGGEAGGLPADPLPEGKPDGGAPNGRKPGQSCSECRGRQQESDSPTHPSVPCMCTILRTGSHGGGSADVPCL